jgi:hypothetical protein
MSNHVTSILARTLATVGVLFVGSQAMAQAGPPPGIAGNVTVTNTPLPVTVTNPTVPPSTVNVGNPAALAAANAQAFKGTPVSVDLGTTGTYSVPVGQRLNIEYVSGQCLGFTLDGITFFLSPFLVAVTGGIKNSHRFTLPTPFIIPAPSAGFGEAFGHVVKIYADAGSNITLQGAQGCSFVISGQLVTP